MFRTLRVLHKSPSTQALGIISKLMRYLLILLILSCASGCIWIPQGHLIPHANIKLLVPSNSSSENVIRSAEQAILALGYEKQSNDWERWVNILHGDELEKIKLERTYTRDDFKITYSPEYEVTLTKTGAIHIHFHQENSRQFDQVGITEYEKIEQSLTSVGLEPAAETEIDRESYREVFSPLEFNERHPPPTTRKKLATLAYGGFAAAMYSLFIFWPGFKLLLRIFTQIKLSLWPKRALFSLASGLALAPAPVPLSMFGPILFAPFPLVMPFTIGLGDGYTFYLAFAVMCTIIISIPISLLMKPKAK